MPLDIPGYKILRTLGRGGMARVYLAIQEVFEREVALKVMSRALAEDPNFGQRFFREAKIVSKLVHPNIVTVHDVGMHDGYCFLSMEYIDGQDLKHAVGRLSLSQKIRCVYDICKALDYAGSKGYVHRDIKPENIMFHLSDGRAVLMDFGIARAAESDTQVTQAGTAIGTPHYMSPEQAKGKAVDARSDIYSLGVVFFYVLSGHVPFDAESAVAIGIKHITEPVPLLPKTFEALQPIIDKMMAKRVEDRYQSAKELMEDLDHIDIDVLEHTVAFSSIVSRGADPNATTEISRPLPSALEDYDEDEDDYEQPPTRKLDEYEVEETSHDGPKLPWVIAGLFVVAVGLGFAYVKHPEMFAPITALFEAKPSEERLVQPSIAPTLAPSIAPKNVTEANPESPTEIINDPLPEQTSPPEMSSADLEKRVRRLEEAYVGDAIYLSELVDSYRQWLELDTRDLSRQAEFDQFRENELAKLEMLAKESGRSPNLAKRISQMKSLFPEIQQARFSDIESLAKTRQRVLTLIVEAESYLKQNNLTQPAGRNALDYYNEVLKLDPENTKAKTGKANIAQKLADLSDVRLKEKNYEAALGSADKALAIDGNNALAKQVRSQASSVVDRKQRIRRLLSDAEDKIQQGQLFTPEGQGAFHDFQKVLQLDPNNSTAKAGMDRVVDALSTQVWQLVGDEQFIQAKELMRVSVRAYGSNQRIKALSEAVDEVIGDKVMNVEPRIDNMHVRAEPIDPVSIQYRSASHQQNLRADRSIYLGFRYQNFHYDTTVVQAVLMDGAKRLQIAQVPVVLKGVEGESSIRIDRPVEGFPAGSYSVEMRLGQQTLHSTLFNVE